MTVIVRNNPTFKYTIADTGEPGAGYKLFTYEEGTSTKKTTWTSLAKTAENTNPIILDADGEADVWIDGNYKFVLALPTDTDPPTSPVKTWDAIRSGTDAAASSTANGAPSNGSFETDSDSDGVPDNWTVQALSGGSIAIDNTTSSHGENSLKFTSTGAGGGSASTEEYDEVEAGKDIGVYFSIISADADTHNVVDVYWYDSSKVFLSNTSVYDDAATNPTTWTRKYYNATAPATAKYARIVLTGVAADSTTHSTTHFENIELDNKFTGELDAAIQASLNNLTATVIELNTLDGITSTTAELNILDGVTATTAEINYSDGVTSNIQTQLDNKSGLDTWSLIEEWTPTTVNQKAFTWDESLYDSLLLVIRGVSPAVDNIPLYAKLGYNNGAAYYAAPSDYVFAVEALAAGAYNATALGTSLTSVVPLTSTDAANTRGVGNAANEGASAEITLVGANSVVSHPEYAVHSVFSDNASGVYSNKVFGNVSNVTADTTQIDTIAIYWGSSVAFQTKGKMFLYGLRTS